MKNFMKLYQINIKSLRDVDYAIEAESRDEALAEAIGIFLDEDSGIDNLEVQILSEE